MRRDIRGNGRAFRSLVLKDGEKLQIGGLTIEVMYTPGHTPACISYRIGDNVFVGDTLFMPDYGTARCDFPGGDARFLYRSIRHILSLPPETILWMCHDYGHRGRDTYAWKTTVGEAAREEHPYPRRRERRVLRRYAQRARQDLGRAGSDFAVGASEHSRRPYAAAGKRRQYLSQTAGEHKF